MELALRGLGDASAVSLADCYARSSCRTYVNLGCYTTGWFTDFCKSWRAYEPGNAATGALALPPSIKPPVIDTTPGSPTYGQAMVNGHVVDTPEDAQRLIDQQIAEQHAAQQRQTQTFFEGEAAGACATKADECGMFTSLNAECTDCVFDPTKPAFLIGAFIFVALMVAKPWK